MCTAFFVCVCVFLLLFLYLLSPITLEICCIYPYAYCVVSHCFNFDSLMWNWIWMWSHISIIIFNICLEKWRNCCLVEYRTTHWIVMVCTSSLHFVSFYWYAFFFVFVVFLLCSIEFGIFIIEKTQLISCFNELALRYLARCRSGMKRKP